MLQYQYWDVMSRETKPTKDLWLKSRHVKPRNKQFSICTIGSKSTTIKYQIKFCMYVEAISISGMLKVYLNYMNISLYLENKYWNEVASGKITWITTCNRDGQNLKLHCNCFCRLKNLIFRPYFKSKKLIRFEKLNHKNTNHFWFDIYILQTGKTAGGQSSPILKYSCLLTVSKCSTFQEQNVYSTNYTLKWLYGDVGTLAEVISRTFLRGSYEY